MRVLCSSVVNLTWKASCSGTSSVSWGFPRTSPAPAPAAALQFGNSVAPAGITHQTTYLFWNMDQRLPSRRERRPAGVLPVRRCQPGCWGRSSVCCSGYLKAAASWVYFLKVSAEMKTSNFSSLVALWNNDRQSRQEGINKKNTTMFHTTDSTFF